MPTLTAVIVPAKALKGGRHKIRVAVAHKGQTRYIVTDITIDSSKEFRNGSIVRRPDAAMLNTRLRGLLQKFQDAVYKVPYLDGMTCAELVDYIKNGDIPQRHTLQSVAEEYFSLSKIRDSTRELYKSQWRRIIKYVNPSMDIANVTHSTLLSLVSSLRKHGLSATTIHNDMVFFSSVINLAKRCGYASYRIDPCAGLSLPAIIPRDSWLSVKDIRKLRDLELTGALKKGRDIFMLSYYLGGMNIADLSVYNFDDHPDTVKYVRHKTSDLAKTNKYVEFKMPEEAKEIIAKYKGPDGRIVMTSAQRKRKLHPLIGYALPILSEIADLPQLVYYSARKSFGQHAFDLGVSESVIDYILGHKLGKGGTSLFSYIAVTSEMATKAIRLVLDNLKKND